MTTPVPTQQVFPLDRHGVSIKVGDTVKSPAGFVGEVVFENCALRVDVSPKRNGAYLNYNSSLLYCDSWEPCQFEVIK